jgi:signal transduction histidine kinase
LLLEPQGDELVAWAAKGLEEEVQLGVHVPLGKGITGRLASERAPVRVDDLDRVEVFNPLLRQKGVRSLLGVPLLVEGRLVGVLHVGTLEPRQFTDDDEQLLQLVADRIALASENTRLYEQERSLRREAEAANRAKDVFLSILSHELRTPLTAIIGWVHMMRRGMLKEKEFVRGFDVIYKNSKMLKRLINDLLDMSAILTGKMRMERQSVELKSVVLEAVENLRPHAAERDIHLEVSFGDWDDSLTVDGDSTRLMQTFSNLLHNAVKFSAAGGHVRVTGVANGDSAVVKVEDQGQGIAADFLPHVFERFRQADGADTRGGLGMGLALAKSFVEAHGGTIEAASEGEGRGSKFTVRLPCRTQIMTPEQ